MQAGIYVRISLDRGGEGLGVERQETTCRTKATSLGWTVSEVYVDNDVSATKTAVRPEYQRLLTDLRAGTINAVIVYAIDRLTRKPAELEAFIDLVEAKGIALANVAGDVDLSTIQGRLTARIMGSVARAEAENIGKRVRDQKAQRAAKGIPHKGRHRVFGYNDSWELIASEAAVIKEAFQRRGFGESTTAIAKDFTNRGITTVSGNNWTSGTLGETLTKHVYCGKVTFKGEVVADSIYPAIVDEATFNAAQRELANDAKGTNARKYLLSGFLTCELCFTVMKGNPASKMYRCSTTYGGCGKLSVRIAIADEYAFNAAWRAHQDRPQDTDTGRDFDTEIATAQVSLKKVQSGYEAGIYSLPEAADKTKAIKAEITDLQKQQAARVPKLGILQLMVDFEEWELSKQRAFLSIYIDRIGVGRARSRGNQPFDPSRFEFFMKDGTHYRPTRPTKVHTFTT